jgi:hypothetical protein
MTRAALVVHAEVSDHLLGSTLSRLSHPTKTLPKRIYVRSWVTKAEGGRNYPRAVYALGSKDNCSRPKKKSTRACRLDYMRKCQRIVHCANPLKFVKQIDARKLVASMRRLGAAV